MGDYGAGYLTTTCQHNSNVVRFLEAFRIETARNLALSMCDSMFLVE